MISILIFEHLTFNYEKNGKINMAAEIKIYKINEHF